MHLVTITSVDITVEIRDTTLIDAHNVFYKLSYWLLAKKTADTKVRNFIYKLMKIRAFLSAVFLAKSQ